jgi:signal transduction histidine kinase
VKQRSRHGMRGLFWRIFALSWLAMTLVGVGFSLYVALSYPTERMERRAQRFMSTLGLQGTELLRIKAERGDEALTEEMQANASDLDVRIWLVSEGRVFHGTEPAEAAVLAIAERATAAGVREQLSDRERIAVQIRPQREGSRWVLVVENPRPSPLMRALERETQRLVLIVLVAGVFSWLLARYITRPMQRLREATGRIADGDLSVRVMPELGRSSAELVELATDFDLMAERLEHLIKSQQRLLRDVSHELRSPLARLGVALELARQRSGEAAQSALDRIERDALRLGELISEILQLSRLDARVVEEGAAMHGRLDLSGLVQEVVSDVDFEAQGQGKRVEAQLPAGVEVRGDTELLRRAVENVLRNAVRFSPEGGVVEVRLARESGGLVLAVRDRGPGVPEGELVDIFRPFHRVGSARDRDSGGAGIGLAIVERSVKLHGGRVYAENAEGGGLRVVFLLPGV